ncbi:MAG: hypothetical protein M3R47_15240 [Chloroflexota bacterium]|nr:hypothetical protein [Chloroflexota bacterium]
MDNQPSFDRGLVIPALIGIFSVIGIISVLLINRYVTSRAIVPMTATVTPFKYIFLGTEPAISTEVLPEESAAAPTQDEPSVPTTEGPVILVTPTNPNTPATSTTPNPGNTVVPTLTGAANITASPTSASGPPLNPGTYDDIDFRLIYTGNWSNQTNVSGAYQGTLHISTTLTTPGNSVTFRFIGQEVRILYQSGASLGVARITLDTTQTLLNQSATSNELVLTAATSGTHTVTITHLSGGSVNLDSVIIPSVGTPTATATATPTP